MAVNAALNWPDSYEKEEKGEESLDEGIIART